MQRSGITAGIGWALILSLGAGIGAMAAPELIVDIDVNDEVWLRDHAMTGDDVKTLVAQLKANGTQTLIVRCGCLGLLPYQTDLSYPTGFDAEHARANPTPIVKDMESFITQRTAWNERYAKVIADINPPEAFVRAGHAHGMKVILWIDLFDDGFPGYRSKFLDEHPHCQWVGKDGTTHFKGLTDYSWPEARAFRVAQARELLDLGADGIHCSTSSHCRHLPNTHEEDFYGYSGPIVQAFQAEHNVDIRTAEDFDRDAWHDLKGEAMVQLYRELAALCHGRGKELWVGLQLGRYTQFAVDPHFSTNVVARFTNHWKTMVDEGIADAFIVGDYEIVASPGHAYWSAKPDIQRQEGEDLYAWAARHYQPYCKGKTRLYLFSEWMPHDPVQLEARAKFWAEVTQKNGFDGIDMHEAWNFESHPDNMAVLGRMAVRLKGGALPYALWDPAQPVPTAKEAPLVEGVRFEVIKAREPEVDGYNWLHGVAACWHKGTLYTSWGHNKGDENTPTEEARGRHSTDGGKHWDPVWTIGSHTESEGRSHGVFLSLEGTLWALVGRFQDKYTALKTEAFTLDEASGSPGTWVSRGIAATGFWPCDEPKRMSNGNWIMAGMDIPDGPKWAWPAVAISHGDDLTQWDTVRLPLAEHLRDIWGESSVIVEPDEITVLVRAGWKHDSALVSTSQDLGQTWSPVQWTNLPMPCTKVYTGLLSTGQRYAVGTLVRDHGGKRYPLTIAVSRPGEKVFSKVFRIRDGVYPEGPGESVEGAALSYPYATEHDGNLYVVYSNDGGRGRNLNSAEMAVLPVTSLAVPD